MMLSVNSKRIDLEEWIPAIILVKLLHLHLLTNNYYWVADVSEIVDLIYC